MTPRKPPRHSDWHKLVPQPLLDKPPLWHGPRPVDSKGEKWRTFRAEVAAFEHQKLEELRQHFKIPYEVASDEFYVHLAVHLCSLFPAFQTKPESRGRKRQAVVEPESAARRVKRDRKRK